MRSEKAAREWRKRSEPSGTFYGGGRLEGANAESTRSQKETGGPERRTRREMF